MRLVTYRSERGARAGILVGDGLVDAGDAYGGDAATVREVLAAHSPLDEAGPPEDTVIANVDDVELLPPVPDPEKIICIGLNYRAHAAEAGIELPSTPTFFAKFRNALAPPDATVSLPAASDKVDYEAEIAFVIGRRCSGVSREEASQYVAGYMLFNDLSARDVQFATPQWMPGKIFDGSAPCGPALVTEDEVAGSPISFSLTLNGTEMQAASTDDLIFDLPELVAHLSALVTLEPGDIVATGTPAGVGSTRQPRVWLKPGDEIVISSPQLGRLVTRIR